MRVRKLWISTTKFTVQVNVWANSNIICEAAPVVAKFKGQHIERLLGWIRKIHSGALPRIEELS